MKAKHSQLNYFLALYILFILFSNIFFSQDKSNNNKEIKESGHYNNSAYKELDSELPTPNSYRTASGAPGKDYYQQKADYVMDIELDENKQTINGIETITYHNFSPDKLEYLWVQLDQNEKRTDSPGKLSDQTNKAPRLSADKFSQNYIEQNPDFGFNIEYIKDSNGKALSYTINHTMMRIDLEKPLLPNEKFIFKIKWNYLINDYIKFGGRSGYEHFPTDNNNVYVIAQFFPRMAVYNDVEGWQNLQFWGSSEFALPFGDYKVNITLPADYVINGTGTITNLKENLTSEQYNRWLKATKTYDSPVLIINEQEARIAETKKSITKKTWKFDAKNVRDFAFSASRKFIWDAMAVKLEGKDVMAISLYPKEGNPLWEKYSTRVVAHTLKEYSKMTFAYPYEKAISVHAHWQGMEYPMICWNYGRPDPDGKYSDATKFGMISVIIHEVGHNYFPMIVNSDERQWTWMDEGLNSFLQFITEQNMHVSFPNEFSLDKNYPSKRGFPKDIVDYMSMNQEALQPIMTQGDFITNLGANAYGKPAIGLNILRTTVLGKDLFDFSFKTYANRWKFKHPTPADFFRTMEDASGTDLDWFFRGWFYTTDFCDIGIKKVTPFILQYSESKEKATGRWVSEENVMFDFKENPEINPTDYTKFKEIAEFVEKLPNESKSKLKNPKYFYEVEFERPGKLIMPIISKFIFEDGTSQEIRFPYLVWRKNEHRNLTKFFAFEKKLKEIIIDAKLETADIDTQNNSWKSDK